MQFEKKQTEAYWPRGPGSSIFITDKLKVVYLKASANKPAPQNCTIVNFIFAHGTGMNKSVWKAHIAELYKRNESQKDWKIGSCISVDAVGHGDSGLLNKGKIAWGNDWRDGAKDLITVVKHEIQTTGDFLPSVNTRNIIVGHSMGGFHATFASFLEPVLFDACVAIEPVIFIDEGVGPFLLERLKKIKKILKDEFSSRDQALTFFQKDSFYKVMDPKVGADFADDEIYFENGKFRTKTTIDAQLAAYLSAVYSIQFGQNILLLIETPYLFITGKLASWNSPNSDEHIETSVPAHLLQRAKLDGDHLVHALNVEDTVTEIYNFASCRVSFIEANRDKCPDVNSTSDRSAKVKSMIPQMWKGDMGRAFSWDRPQVKL